MTSKQLQKEITAYISRTGNDPEDLIALMYDCAEAMRDSLDADIRATHKQIGSGELDRDSDTMEQLEMDGEVLEQWDTLVDGIEELEAY
jgi:hypothetical protein